LISSKWLIFFGDQAAYIRKNQTKIHKIATDQNNEANSNQVMSDQ